MSPRVVPLKPHYNLFDSRTKKLAKFKKVNPVYAKAHNQ